MQKSPQKPALPSKITIRDVARQAGVTMTTVSSALSGRGRVSPETRERVRTIAEELGYQPKFAAQMMRAQSTGHIGLILPGGDIGKIGSTSHPGAILGNFVHLCEQRNVTYHIESWSEGRSAGAFAPPRLLVNGLADGVLVGGYVGHGLTEWLGARRRVWVSVDEPADYCTLSRDDDGVYLAVQRLAALGHRRIAYAGGPVAYMTHRLGLEGFRRARADFGLQVAAPEWEMSCGSSQPREMVAETRAWAGSVLAAPLRPSAVVCHDVAVARTVIHAALARGLEIPRDLSLITASSALDAEKSPLALSSIEVDFRALVEQAMDILLQRLDGRIIRPETRYVQPCLIMRDTVGPVAAG